MRGAPIPPTEYVDEGDEVLTDEVLKRDGWAAGLDVWEQMGKAYEHYLYGGRGDHPTGLDNAQMWSLQEAIKAHPRRDDPVAEWLKRRRDAAPDPVYRDAFDALLDDYQLHADTSTPLTEDVQGPHGEAS